jgi:hypothetical protein
MEASSQNPVNLAYFYPHSNSCPERIARANDYGVQLNSYRQLYLLGEAKFEGHTRPNFALPNGQLDWDDNEVEEGAALLPTLDANGMQRYVDWR